MDQIAHIQCADGSIGFTRRCNSYGQWKDPEGPGCRCPREQDHQQRWWEGAVGGSIQSQTCAATERGTLQRICDPLGQWKKVRNHCIRRACDDTWTQGVFLASKPIETVVTLPCTNGEGSFQFVCTPQERWQIVSSACACKELRDEDGYLWPASLANSTHLLPCQEGYDGLIQRRCGVNGEWESRNVGCTEKTCPLIHERHITFPATPLHTVVTLPCPVPYEGTVQRVCGSEEQWGSIIDHCIPPTCHDLILGRNHHGCITVDAVHRALNEQVTVMVLPSPTTTQAIFNATLPASICDLSVNIPYEVWIQRYATSSIRSHICVLNNMYSFQQCETMPAPILQERINHADGQATVRVLVTVPFCFDQVIQFIQVKLECISQCEEAHPKILKHVCSEAHPCIPGNFLSLTSFPNLHAMGTYRASARAVPAKSPLALASPWSTVTLIEPHFSPILLQPQLTVIPKSSYSVKLQWTLPPTIPIKNLLLYIFVSSPHDKTMDPRYLTFVDSQPLCPGQEVCQRKNIVVPVTDLGIRYVYLLEARPVHSQGVQVRNGTATYIVPAAPSVRSLVTNYDTYVNVTFLEANMDLMLECILFDDQAQQLTTFSLSVSYQEVVWQIIGDLVSMMEYTLRCSVRDGFKILREFSLNLHPVASTPVMVSLNITKTTYSHVLVTLSANKQGSFYCIASNARTPGELANLAPAAIDAMGFKQECVAPLIPMDIAIPYNEIYSEYGRLDSQVFVVCDFVTSGGARLVASKLLKGKAPAPQGNHKK